MFFSRHVQVHARSLPPHTLQMNVHLLLPLKNRAPQGPVNICMCALQVGQRLAGQPMMNQPF